MNYLRPHDFIEVCNLFLTLYHGKNTSCSRGIKGDRGEYYSFFKSVNRSLDSYLDIIGTDNWVNVSVREDGGLPDMIAQEIKERFIIMP